MTNPQSEIPLACDDECSNGRPAPGIAVDDEAGAGMPLESARLSLLAVPRVIRDTDRRMEEWIASNLDLDERPRLSARSPWIRLIDGLPGLKRPHAEKRAARKVETSVMGWTRFQVAYMRGITVVRLIDRSLVKEAQVRELACDLLDLIEAGNHRIVLNFQAVERLASWVVIAVDEARRLCETADGGALKICGLPRRLASIFPLVGVALGNALHGDEPTAIDSPWPDRSGPRALPIEILAAVTRCADIRPICGGAPIEATEIPGPAAPQCQPGDNGSAAPGLDGLWLNVQVGGAKGRSVAVTGSRFVIGRDRACQLRLGSPMVSKFHAAIERKESGIVLQDLGSTNGTVHNGRALRNGEIAVNEGDRIQIGPIVATLCVGPPRAETEKVDEMVAGWLNREGSVVRSYQNDAQPTEFFPAHAEPDPEAEPLIQSEVIQEVLVITPKLADLDDEGSNDLLRQYLQDRFEQPTPRQVVINLECVRHLNAQAIGVLLAHHLRLDRTGGALRMCQAHPRLMALLHHVRLTVLVEFYPTLDEAVLAAWPGA